MVEDLGTVAKLGKVALRRLEKLAERLFVMIGKRRCTSCSARPAYMMTCTVSMPDNSSKNQPQLVYISMA